MTGAVEEEYERATNAELKPTKTMNDGISVFLLETEVPLYLSDWAAELAQTNFKAKANREKKRPAKM